MKKYNTEQEEFWAGKFGDDYSERNINAKILAGNIMMFSKIISSTSDVTSVIEFGANMGLNLIAIRAILPHVEVSAVELNRKALKHLEKIEGIKTYHQSLLDFAQDYTRDFVLVKTVLIHINPDLLNSAYELLYNTSKKYICIAQYYNPTPVSIDYRGHKNKLFKRDFAGEMLDKFADLRLVTYGFTYHRDNYNEFDDTNWFLLEKKDK